MESEQGDGGAQEERAALRALALGPCKQACLLLGEMAFSAYRAQLKANAGPLALALCVSVRATEVCVAASSESAGLKARNEFYDTLAARRLGDEMQANASASFEEQLEAQLEAQLGKHAQAAHDWGLATVRRCMTGCVGLRDPARIRELCDCIEYSSDLPAASKCFDASMAGSMQPVGASGQQL